MDGGVVSGHKTVQLCWELDERHATAAGFQATTASKGAKLRAARDWVSNRKNLKLMSDAVRFGLAGIKNVGTGAAQAILDERMAGGPYSGMIDLCSRVDSSQLNKKAIESLVRAGAMDGFEMHRARIFNGIDFASARAASALRELLERAAAEGLRGTDDAALFEHYDRPVTLVPGETTNVKLTAPDDLDLAAAILRTRGGREVRGS